MTGWRIGYAAGPEWIIKKMAKLQGQITSCPNSIAQYASLAALRGGEEEVQKMVKAFEERRNYIVERLNNFEGVYCKKPSGAFYVFPDFREVIKRFKMKDSNELALYILEKTKVACVSGGAFGRDGFLRMSYATSMEEIKEGMDRLEELINGK